MFEIPQKRFAAIIEGDVLKALAILPSDSVDTVATSPPYWGLRDYQVEPSIWGGDASCEHDFSQQAPPRRSRRESEKQYGGKQATVRGSAFDLKGTNFCSKCGGWKGCLGLEPIYSMYVDHLIQVMHEVKRVLKPTGSLWLNIGDTYSASGGAGGDYNEGGLREGQPKWKQGQTDLPAKCLVGIPERVMLGMIDDGWILRNKIIWSKGNGLPSPVADRFTNKHESIFFFTKKPHYWFDLDAVRVPHKIESWGLRKDGKYEGNPLKDYEAQGVQNPSEIKARMAESINPLGGNPGDVIQDRDWKEEEKLGIEIMGMRDPHRSALLGGLASGNAQNNPNGKNPGDVWKRKDPDEIIQGEHSINKKGHSGYYDDEGNLLVNPLGANPGDHWTINTLPFPGSHFAVFPPTIPERVIKCSTPQEICVNCGKARERLTNTKTLHKWELPTNHPQYRPRPSYEAEGEDQTMAGFNLHKDSRYQGLSETIGWSVCSCPEPKVYRPGIVMDIFAGSGTTALVAQQQGRSSISIELNPSYVKMIKDRINFGQPTILDETEWRYEKA